MDGSLLEICMPPGTRVNAWLSAGRGGGPPFFLLFLHNAGYLCVDIMLYQGIDHVGKGGGCIQGVDLEEQGWR